MASTNDPRDFFSLPPELRTAIYELILVSSNPLRPARSFERSETASDPAPTPFNTSLFLANRLIYDEAKAIFYKKNLFFYPVFPYGLFTLRPNPTYPLRPNYLTNMPLMTHITLHHTRRDRQKLRFRSAISEYLNHVTKTCPALTTLTLVLQHETVWTEPRLEIPNLLQHVDTSSCGPTGLTHLWCVGGALRQLLQLPALERATVIAQIPLHRSPKEEHEYRMGLGAAWDFEWLRDGEGRGDDFADLSQRGKEGVVGSLVRGTEEMRAWTVRVGEEKRERRRAERGR